jgi:4-amino-4-deoxy-L-arabinose transferase-like glycosyltransferase
MSVTAGGASQRVASALHPGALIDFATRSHARAVALLIVAALLSFLPGFFAVPPLDRDEARFAQASKQMVETGNYYDIRFQDEVRYKKPVGIYWLQTAAVNVASALGFERAMTTIWLYRLPSLFGAVGAVLLTYWTALAFVSRRSAVLAGLMLTSCFLLSVEARLAKTDAMLLMTIVAAMGALARCYLPNPLGDERERWMLAAVFWTALAAGVLLKGPVILLFVGLPVVALTVIDRSARWLMALKPLPGLIWFALLVLPWFIVILSVAGTAFITESAGHDMLSKIFGSAEGHGAPPGYYFLLFWLTFWPGATLAALATPGIFAARRAPAVKFLLAWLVPAWVVFELVVTKLPHYVLPLYPAVAILIAGAIEGGTLSRKPVLVRGTLWFFIVPLLVGVALIVAQMVIGRQLGLAAWPLFGASAAMGFLAWRSYESEGAEPALVRAVAGAILLVVATFGLVLPALAPLFPSAALARVLRESGCAQPLAASAGYHEPSLVFLAGTTTVLTDSAQVADFMRGGECRFGFIDTRREKVFVQRAEANGLRYSAGPRIDAINIGSGERVTIAVFRSGAPP